MSRTRSRCPAPSARFVPALLLTSILALAVACPATGRTAAPRDRDEIDDRYKWDLSDLYADDAAWEADAERVEEMLPAYEGFKGRLGESAATLLACLRHDDAVASLLERVFLYAKLPRDLDFEDPANQSRWSRYSSLSDAVTAAGAFLVPEIGSLDAETLGSFLAEEEGLAEYRHYLEDLRRRGEHALSQEQEDVLARMKPVLNKPYDLWRRLIFSEIPYPEIPDDQGGKIPLNRSTSWRSRRSQDREFRRAGYEDYYAALGAFKGTLAENLNTFMVGRAARAELRGHANTLEAVFDRYAIPTDVHANLLRTIADNPDPLRRWMRIKRRRLGLDTLRVYDTEVSMFAAVEKSFDYDEAYALMLQCLEPMGEPYLAKLREAYEKRWVDVYPSPGKEGGGYSSGPYLPHPYVKMNWDGSLPEFFTLVHEMGHFVHATRVLEDQPFVYQDYPSFLGEIASTTAENVAQFHLIDTAESPDEKLYYIEQYLNNACLLVYTATLVADFERTAYARAEQGDPMSAEEMTDEFHGLCRRYYGDSVGVTELDGLQWLSWPHLYFDYYVYSYATSFAAAIQLAEDIRSEGAPAAERFREFLGTGTSEHPIEALKRAGVDMTTPAPFVAFVEKMNALIDEAESLLATR